MDEKYFGKEQLISQSQVLRKTQQYIDYTIYIHTEYVSYLMTLGTVYPPHPHICNKKSFYVQRKAPDQRGNQASPAVARGFHNLYITEGVRMSFFGSERPYVVINRSANGENLRAISIVRSLLNLGTTCVQFQSFGACSTLVRNSNGAQQSAACIRDCCGAGIAFHRRTAGIPSSCWYDRPRVLL